MSDGPRVPPAPDPVEIGPVEDGLDLDEDDQFNPIADPPPTAPVRCVVWTVPPVRAGERLDKALAEGVTGLSRQRIQSLLAAGQVSIADHVISEGSRRVKAGQVYRVTIPAPVAALPQPQALPLTIVFEDDDVVVVDKPAGLVVHPAAGNPDGTLVNALLFHCRNRLSGIGGVLRPGIVHRLDKDTSGLLVAAKTDRAHAGLAAQFADRTLRRTYLAVVWGVPCPASGEVADPIGRDPHDRKRMAVVTRGGKPALTRYQTRQSFAAMDAALVECRLQTGRTHQIRVHLASRGHPVVGDQVYGGRRSRRPAKGRDDATCHRLIGFPRQALHAAALEFRHPGSGATLQFASQLPDDMQALVTCLCET